jgi:hypothetical protein
MGYPIYIFFLIGIWFKIIHIYMINTIRWGRSLYLHLHYNFLLEGSSFSNIRYLITEIIIMSIRLEYLILWFDFFYIGIIRSWIMDWIPIFSYLKNNIPRMIFEWLNGTINSDIDFFDMKLLDEMMIYSLIIYMITSILLLNT